MRRYTALAKSVHQSRSCAKNSRYGSTTISRETQWLAMQAAEP